MTTIEWTNTVWNPTVGCLPERLAVPLRWRKPRLVFVDSMSDLFHPGVPFEFIAAVFGVMAATPRHTYQLLTKRDPREFFRWYEGDSGAGATAVASVYAAREAGVPIPDDKLDLADDLPWPLPNVWLGVSVEDQATADERVPHLLECPAALRFVSYEPALGPVDCRRWTDEHACSGHQHDNGDVEQCSGCLPSIDWIIVGGESGNGARPFDVAWARSVIEQACGTGCRVFVKQLGAKPVRTRSPNGAPDDGGDVEPIVLASPKGKEPSEWPEDLRVQEMPEAR